MSRTLVIGDIHGCFTALRSLLDAVALRDDDTLVTLGDYCDRGPRTREVLDHLLELRRSHRLIALRGNHELMMLDARTKPDHFRDWLSVGGRETLLSYGAEELSQSDLSLIPTEHWQFVERELVPYSQTETHFFVHANAYPDIELEEQPDYMLYWERFSSSSRHCSGKIMICGHTPQKSGYPRKTRHAVCLDTWAYGSGWLTCCHVEAGFCWQANEAGETRRFWLDDL